MDGRLEDGFFTKQDEITQASLFKCVTIMAFIRDSEDAPSLTLAEVLRIKNPDRFLSALADLAMPSGTGPVSLSERSEPVRMIITLNFFYTEIAVSGIWHFLVDHEAPVNVPAARSWCLRINAQRAAAYLAAAVKLFPKERLPQSQARRDAWVRRMDYQEPNPLRELDLRYDTAVDEMAECLRRFVRKHLDEFKQALAKPVPSMAVANERIEIDDALAKLKEVVDERQPQKQNHVRRVKQRRGEQGFSDVWRATADDPRRVRFLEEIEKMPLEQWVTVAGRWLAHLSTMRRAMDKIPSIWFEILHGNVYSPEETKRRKAAHDRAKIRVTQALSRLPEIYGTDKLELRDTATWAVNQALIILSALDEIMDEKRGEQGARTILSVFEGLITMPF